MIPAGQRLALWSLALLVSLMSYLKGRVTTTNGGDAASVRPSPGTVVVRLSGALPRPGIYRFPDGITGAAAIKLTVGGGAPAVVAGPGGGARLSSGDVVVLRRRTDGSAEIIVEKMHTKEKMLIGVPLNPDSLEAADWDLLPGIGPALANRIADDRHKNGAFGSLDGVLRVPGVGIGKINIIRAYF